MPATTMTQMSVGRDILMSGAKIHVIIKAINQYLIKDERMSNEAQTPLRGWNLFTYDQARTTFNTNMPNLS